MRARWPTGAGRARARAATPRPTSGGRYAGAVVKRPGALLPEHEGLRRAIAWLLERPVRDAATIEDASRRFDLSPLDEEFLLRYFRNEAAPRGSRET